MPLRDFGTVVKERRAGINNCYTLGELSANMWVPEGGDTQSSIVKTATQKSAVQKAGFNWDSGQSLGQKERKIASELRRAGYDPSAHIRIAENYENGGDIYSQLEEPSLWDKTHIELDAPSYTSLNANPEYTQDWSVYTPQQYADVAENASADSEISALIKKYGPEAVQSALASFDKSAESAESPVSEESEEDVSEDIQKSESPDTFSQVVQELHNRGYTGEQIGQAFTAIIKSAINSSDGNLETAFSAIQKSVSQPDETPAEETPAEPTETVQ